MFRNGFDNVVENQGSCYFTSKEMRYSSVNKIIRNMFRELPWLSECIEKTALYEEPQHVYNFKTHCERLNRSEKHMVDLERYYGKIGMKMSLKVKTDLKSRTRTMSSKNNKENLYVR